MYVSTSLLWSTHSPIKILKLLLPFDEDHVNGLEYLLRHTQVEHIFFPLLTNEDKALIFLQHLVNSASADEQAFWLHYVDLVVIL